jgi:hypothetical protein
MPERKNPKFKCSNCGWIGESESVVTKGGQKNSKGYFYTASLCPKCKKEVGRKLSDG